jgi:cyclophilin family peptidyl-prolyl cis-trans isomerase
MAAATGSGGGGGASTTSSCASPNLRRLSADNAQFCYLDLDFDAHRAKLARGAAFVRATNSRYGFSSPDLRELGGSEVKRIPELLADDHEWRREQVRVRPPSPRGNGRIVLRLLWDVAPLACENFAALCSNPASARGEASGKPLTYRKSNVHRVVPGFVVQGGDVVFGNGTGGESIFGGGKKFKDERPGLLRRHDRRGVLSMGNSGKNSNTSQWFLTLGPAPQCDGKHVVFGHVVSGWDVLEEAERHGTAAAAAAGGNGTPAVPIVVTDCGLFVPLETPGAGYWYDRPDPDAYGGISPVFVARPRVAVVVPNASVAERFQKVLEKSCLVVAVLLESDGSNDQNNDKPPLSRIAEMLETFAVDVVLVAPACRDRVPHPELDGVLDGWRSRWTGPSEALDARRVVVEAKPTDALAAIHSQSWLGTRTAWVLDGTSM